MKKQKAVEEKEQEDEVKLGNERNFPSPKRNISLA